MEGSPMGADYKKLLIKYVDKIVFVVVLALFLVATFKVMTSGPPKQTYAPAIPKGSPPPNPTVYKELYVLNRFTKPPQPDATEDFTSDPEKIMPGPGEKQCPQCGWIVPSSTTSCPSCSYSWLGQRVTAEVTEEEKVEPPSTSTPLSVVAITRKPVDILFMGFMRKVPVENDPIRRGDYDLQINWGGGETTFVRLGETFHDYELFPLEKVEETYHRSGISQPQKRYRYFLTIRKLSGEQKGNPIRVEKGKTVQENEPVATLQVNRGEWQVIHRGAIITRGEKTFDIYGGYVLTEIGGEQRTYKVLEVKDREVVLEDEEGKQVSLSL
jgi:hypothetical protein